MGYCYLFMLVCYFIYVEVGVKVFSCENDKGKCGNGKIYFFDEIC